MTNNNKQQHIPVLLKEVLVYLNPKKGDVIVDATMGLGGHSEEFLKKIGTEGKLIGIDKDREALNISKRRLKKYKNVIFVKGDFIEIKDIVKGLGFEKVDKVLADIGVSSYQIDEIERGFSFKSDGPLDMRMDKESDIKASDIVNGYSEKELEVIFKSYGEEKFSHRIAMRIKEVSSEKKIETTAELKAIIVEALPIKYKKTLRIDPATKVFQALRVEVNRELKALGGFLPQATRILKKGGRLGVISFHSLEDRMVKNFFRQELKGCVCPSDFPVCRCDNKPTLKAITKKPVMADKKEVNENPRSRSAKFRVVEKL